jgi:hypothetical protein
MTARLLAPRACGDVPQLSRTTQPNAPRLHLIARCDYRLKTDRGFTVMLPATTKK